MAKLAMMITSKAKPGSRDELYDLYREHLAPRAEANDRQEVVVWCTDDADDDLFHLFEIYADQDSFHANAGSEFFAEYMQAAGPLLAGEPEVRLMTPRWSMGV